DRATRAHPARWQDVRAGPSYRTATGATAPVASGLRCDRCAGIPVADGVCSSQVLRLQRTRNLFHFKDFDLVADLDVVVALHRDATLHAVTHFGDIVLEATQGFQLALKDHHVIAQDANRAITVQRTLDHHTTGHGTELGRAEHVAHFGNAEDFLAFFRRQQTAHGVLHVVDQLIDDRVVTQVDTFALAQALGSGIGTHVEAQQYRAGGHRQVDVGFVDRTDTTGNDIDLHFVRAQVAQRRIQDRKST